MSLLPGIGIIWSKAVHELIMTARAANSLAVVTVASTIDAPSGWFGSVVGPFGVLPSPLDGN